MKISKGLIVNCAIALLSLVMFFLLFAPVINWGASGGGISIGLGSMSGFEAYLGAGDHNATAGGVMVLIFIILIFLLSVCSVVLEILKPAALKKNMGLINMIVNLVIAALAVVTAIFFFCGTTELMVYGASNLNNNSLAAGAVVDAILGIVIAAGAVVNQFVLK